MKRYFVYILKCADSSYYIGLTQDLEQRFAEHNNGQGGYFTSSRLPVSLVFVQDFGTKDEALVVERQLKGWSRKKKEALIAHRWDALRHLAKKHFK